MKEYRTIIKPWGREEIWAEENEYVGKFLYVTAGHALSRQYHNIKKETITIMSGELSIEIGSTPKSITLLPGQSLTITPGLIHRFIAKNYDVCILEVSTNHLDDVVRVEDNYSRA